MALQVTRYFPTLLYIISEAKYMYNKSSCKMYMYKNIYIGLFFVPTRGLH